MPEQAKLLLLIGVITIISGLADAQGSLHAARIWDGTRVVWIEVGQSSIGFGVGIITYWLMVRYMRDIGITSPEMQTLLWFAVTIVSVTVLSGEFFHWTRFDQLVAVLVLAGVGWLLFRTPS